MSRLRRHHAGDDADECLPVFLRLPALCRAVETNSRTLCVFAATGSVKCPRRSRPEDVARDLMSPAPLQLIAALGGTREPQDPPQQAWLTRPWAVRLLN